MFTDVVRVIPCPSVAIIICLLFFASEYHGYSRTLSVLLRAIPLLSYFVCCFLCIGVSRIYTDVVRVIPCHSVAIIFCLLFFASEYHGITRTLSVLFRAIPLLSYFVCCFFASEFHGYSRTLSVLFRAIPLLSYFVCCFLHRSITDIHGRCPCYSVPFRCYYH